MEDFIRIKVKRLKLLDYWYFVTVLAHVVMSSKHVSPSTITFI